MTPDGRTLGPEFERCRHPWCIVTTSRKSGYCAWHEEKKVAAMQRGESIAANRRKEAVRA